MFRSWACGQRPDAACRRAALRRAAMAEAMAERKHAAHSRTPRAPGTGAFKAQLRLEAFCNMMQSVPGDSPRLQGVDG